MANPWDSVAENFNTYKEAKWWGAMDNIATVWPIFLDYIKSAFPGPKGQALEFGCGTGMFCRELKKIGFKVTGIDVSEEMIKIGRQNLEPEIKLVVGDTKTAKELSEKNGGFDLVTSIMVLQFVEASKLAELASTITNNGRLIFAVHNPLQLEARGVKDCFYVGESKTPVAIYKRTAKDYDQIFLNLGFKKTFETFLQTPEDIQKKYKIEHPIDIRKYLILGYKKN